MRRSFPGRPARTCRRVCICRSCMETLSHSRFPRRAITLMRDYATRHPVRSTGQDQGVLLPEPETYTEGLEHRGRCDKNPSGLTEHTRRYQHLVDRDVPCQYPNRKLGSAREAQLSDSAPWNSRKRRFYDSILTILGSLLRQIHIHLSRGRDTACRGHWGRRTLKTKRQVVSVARPQSA